MCVVGVVKSFAVCSCCVSSVCCTGRYAVLFGTSDSLNPTNWIITVGPLQ